MKGNIAVKKLQGKKSEWRSQYIKSELMDLLYILFEKWQKYIKINDM